MYLRRLVLGSVERYRLRHHREIDQMYSMRWSLLLDLQLHNRRYSSADFDCRLLQIVSYSRISCLILLFHIMEAPMGKKLTSLYFER